MTDVCFECLTNRWWEQYTRTTADGLYRLKDTGGKTQKVEPGWIEEIGFWRPVITYRQGDLDALQEMRVAIIDRRRSSARGSMPARVCASCAMVQSRTR